MTPYAALEHRARTAGAAPLVTYRDLASGERMELSATSLHNAVAKTAGLLRDELDVEPGATVAIHLPLHWQRVVWLGACSAVGAVFASDADPATCDIAVLDRERLELAGAAREDVVVSLAPFGLAEPGGVPPGITDAAVAMRAHPDTFVAVTAVAPDAPLLHGEDGTLGGAAVLSLAADLLADRGIPAGGRFVLTPQDARADILALAGPLACGGSVLLVAHPDAGDLASVLQDEGVPSPAGWVL